MWANIFYNQKASKRRIPSSIIPKSCGSKDERILEAMSITFDDNDVCDAEHHDGLVISLTVSNFLLRRVRVDRGSLANIIFKRALEGMGLCDKNITKRSIVLVGFN